MHQADPFILIQMHIILILLLYRQCQRWNEYITSEAGKSVHVAEFPQLLRGVLVFKTPASFPFPTCVPTSKQYYKTSVPDFLEPWTGTSLLGTRHTLQHFVEDTQLLRLLFKKIRACKDGIISPET